MIRRTFLALVAASALVPFAAQAGETIEYEPGVIQEALDRGETVFVDYYTSWCSTCAAQERRIEALRAADPAYDAGLTFIKVDYDIYADHEVSTSRNIPRRSTLIVLKGDDELGRVIAQSSERKVKGLMDAGLAAAGS